MAKGTGAGYRREECGVGRLPLCKKRSVSVIRRGQTFGSFQTVNRAPGVES